MFDIVVQNGRRAPQIAVHVAGQVTVSGLPAAVEEELIHRTTFANPAFAKKARLGFSTWNTDESIELWRRTERGLVVPRGAFEAVRAVLARHGLRSRTVDRTIRPALHIKLRPAGALFPYQQRALNDLLLSPTGVLEAPTGSGKTNILLSVIPQVQTPTLILTHTAELCRQTRERCREWLGIAPGVIGAGKMDLRPVTVAMIQTLVKREPVDFASRFGCVLADECHHVPAKTWADVQNVLPARFKYGFTATPQRKDGLEFMLWETIGPITARISRAEVVAAGKIVTPDIECVHTRFSFNLAGTSDWSRMISALVNDETRNDLIAAELRRRLTPQTRALILSDRIDHVRILAARLREYDPVVLTGQLQKAERSAAMSSIRAGAPLTIATTGLLGEGVDVPGWDLLLMATPMAGGPRTMQAIGRVSRAASGKGGATVVDFVDSQVPALLIAYEQRERLYRQAS